MLKEKQMTTLEKTHKLPPLEKIATLVKDLDELRSQVTQQISQEQPLDDLVDVVCLDVLSEQFYISVVSLKKKLELAGGKVFKLGKKYVIRKVCFLEVLKKLEQAK